jgi:hypothetical protein
VADHQANLLHRVQDQAREHRNPRQRSRVVEEGLECWKELEFALSVCHVVRLVG